MKRILLVSLLVLVLGFSFIPGVSGAGSTRTNIYIVVFHETQDPEAAAFGLQQEYGVVLGGVYRYALKGAAIQASPRQAAELERDARVRFIELSQVYSINEDQTIPTGIQRIFADDNSNLSINGDDSSRVDADVAILDTGIDFDHPDLNLVMVIDCTWSGPKMGTCEGTRDDGHGHGTHVAGTIGALDNEYGVVGVAPGVRLWAVKVLTNYGTGTTEQVIAGIDWVAEHADQIEVANMSLGGTGESTAMDLAIGGAVAEGVTFVLAAGNRAMDVDNYHPGGHPDAITVSALADFDGLPGGLGEPTCRDDIDDTLADFSNYGAGVDIAAPGVCIYSTYLDGRYATMSGTSMAAPHVSGAAAILASTGEYAPAEIKSALLAAGNTGYTLEEDDPDGIQEPLLDLSNMTVFAPKMVSSESPIQITNALGYTDSGYQYTDLTWDGTNLTLNTDIYRDGKSVWLAAAGETTYTDGTGEKGAGMHYYWVCQTGRQTICSGVVMVDTYLVHPRQAVR